MSNALANLTRADSSTHSEEVLDQLVDELFTFKRWSSGQEAQGLMVRNALKEAYKQVILNVPSSPTRTRALNAIVDARMLANAAITFDGKL